MPNDWSLCDSQKGELPCRYPRCRAGRLTARRLGNVAASSGGFSLRDTLRCRDARRPAALASWSEAAWLDSARDRRADGPFDRDDPRPRLESCEGHPRSWPRTETSLVRHARALALRPLLDVEGSRAEENRRACKQRPKLGAPWCEYFLRAYTGERSGSVWLVCGSWQSVDDHSRNSPSPWLAHYSETASTVSGAPAARRVTSIRRISK